MENEEDIIKIVKLIQKLNKIEKRQSRPGESARKLWPLRHSSYELLWCTV